MTITVRDALQIGGLIEAKVIAGASGLDQEIKAVDIIDVPDAAIWFRRHSLLSTTFYALKDNIDAQLKMLEDIKNCGGAGLIIFSPERYISQIDTRLIKKADELELPLLEMPDCSYIDVIVPVMSQILDKQVKALEYAQEVHSMMTDIVLKGKGLRELLTSLSLLLEKPVLMADADLFLLDAVSPPGTTNSSVPLVEKWQLHKSHLPLSEFYPDALLTDLVYSKKPSYYQYGSADSDHSDFFFPVVAGDHFYGVLVVPDLEQELEKAKTVAFEAGAVAISLHILKENAIHEAERKSELDFYNELLLGNIKNRETIISQARQYGLETSGSYYIILAELSRENRAYDESQTLVKDGERSFIEKRLKRLLRLALEQEDFNAIVVEALGSLVVLVHTTEKNNPEQSTAFCRYLLTALRNYVQDQLGGASLYLAAGDLCLDIERISAGYLEAWETIDIGKKLYSGDFALCYSEMAPYHLVKRLLSGTKTNELFNRVYQPLLHYDHEKGGELVGTLEAYLDCNFSRTKTAEKLHIHRNSLNYRLQKIEELLQCEIDQIDTFPLMLASISRRLSQ